MAIGFLLAIAATAGFHVIYNNDGDDIVHYPSCLPVTQEGFESVRLKSVVGTTVGEVSYTVGTSFDSFNLIGVGHPMTNDIETSCYSDRRHNAVCDFKSAGHDPLEMAIVFARKHGLACAASMRMNDTHDSWADMGLFSPFKKQHPECLVEPEPPKDRRPRYGASTAVDYGQPLVRRVFLENVRAFCSRYDIDALELDFCRHLCYFKSVHLGGLATEAEVSAMNDLMRQVRSVANEGSLRAGHPIRVRVRVPDSPEYDYELGLDVRTWLQDGSIDEVIGGCYFRLNDWKRMADFVHQYGGKFYASLDETRIGKQCRYKKRPYIPGRWTVEYNLGRVVEAWNAGCDGVWWFNHELVRISENTQVRPEAADGLDKIYFATERGGGGYSVDQYLRGGSRHRQVTYIDPSEPLPVPSGCSVAFGIRMGDDFSKAAAKGRVPRVTALTLCSAKNARDVQVAMNGKVLKPVESANGLYSFAVPLETVRLGINAFVFRNLSGGEMTFNDFAVSVKYVKKGEK